MAALPKAVEIDSLDADVGYFLQSDFCPCGDTREGLRKLSA